jgi:hypothetical protein
VALDRLSGSAAASEFVDEIRNGSVIDYMSMTVDGTAVATWRRRCTETIGAGRNCTARWAPAIFDTLKQTAAVSLAMMA